MSDQNADFGKAYLAAHPAFAEAIELLGLDAVADINNVVAGIRPAEGLDVSPGFAPQNIHR